jgi:hypothetical protein
MNENEKIIGETIKALGLGTVVPELYRDLLQPASRELVGTTGRVLLY